MGGSKQFPIRQLASVLFLSFILLSELVADVNLEWRPQSQTVSVGQTIDVALFAVSDNDENQLVGSLAVILLWDSDHLELEGIFDENDEYSWLLSYFHNDRTIDGLNNDCGLDEFCNPYTSLPFNDGTAYYQALGQFMPNPAAVATPEGLLVTTFRFQTLSAGTGHLEIPLTFGNFSETEIISGVSSGLNILGSIGPRTEIEVTTCAHPPQAFAQGSRYLEVTPPSGDVPIALLIQGDPNDLDVSCVSKYIQPDGSLTDEPVFQTPIEWGSILVTGEELIPSSSYNVYTDCGTAEHPELSKPTPTTTWAGGDIDGDGVADSDDLLLILDAPRGELCPTCPPSMDIAGCLPNGIIDNDDVNSMLSAIQGKSYLCPTVCPAELTLANWQTFLDCLSGPAGGIGNDCSRFKVTFNVTFDDGIDLNDLNNLLPNFSETPLPN